MTKERRGVAGDDLEFLRDPAFFDAVVEHSKWHAKARKFKCLADLIPHQSGDYGKCIDVHAYLMGVAIELVLKAILIARGTSAGDAIRGRHDLTKLIGMCKERCRERVCRLERDYSDVFEPLTIYISWAGRYPSPTDLKKLAELFEYEDTAPPGLRITPTTTGPALPDNFNERLNPIYESLIKCYSAK